MARFPTSLVVLVCAVAAWGLPACGSEAPQAAPDTTLEGQATVTGGAASEDAAGSIDLALDVGNARLESMAYAIVGSRFTKSGNLDISNSTTVSGVIGGIPFGSNYALTMSGKSVGTSALDCSGSASFDLSNAGPVPVPIRISCRRPPVLEPAAAMPAPVPPFAVVALAGLLGALGVAMQRSQRASRPRSNGARAR